VAQADGDSIRWQLADIYDALGGVILTPAREPVFGPVWAKLLVDRGELTEAQGAVLAAAAEADVDDAAATFSVRDSYRRRVQRFHALEAGPARLELYTDVASGATAYIPTSDDTKAEEVRAVTTVLAMEPWFVAPDVCALIEHAAPQMPDWVLTEDDLPASGGLIVFANSIETEGSEVDTDVPYWVNAISYMILQDDTSRIVMFDDWEASARVDGRPGWKWTSAGRHHWVIGTHVDDFERGAVRESNTLDGFRAQSAAMRRRIACLWALAKTPRLIEHSELTEPRASRRRAERAGVTFPFVLYDVRPTEYTGTAPGGERPTDWSHRWIVGGHWRQQPHGPGGTLRRPTWIAPHLKGPDDKPLVLKDRVGVVRGDPRADA
jgi:hypothetical protein